MNYWIPLDCTQADGELIPVSNKLVVLCCVCRHADMHLQTQLQTRATHASGNSPGNPVTHPGTAATARLAGQLRGGLHQLV